MIFGDVITDYWVTDESSHLPEHYGMRTACHMDLGGAANTAANLADLGARVTFVGCLPEGSAPVMTALESAGVSVHRITGCMAAAVGSRYRYRTPAGLRRRKGPVSPHDHGDIILDNTVTEVVLTADAVVVSDYNEEDTSALIQFLTNMRSSIQLLVVDTTSPEPWAGVGVDFLKLSYRDFAKASGYLLRNKEPTDHRKGRFLRDAVHLASGLTCGVLAVSNDTRGVFLFDSARQIGRTRPRRIAQEDETVGAGDLFVAATALHLACGISVPHATALGQSAVDSSLLPDRTVRFGRSSSPEDERARAASPRTVFTNGCFDLLHAGHLSLLAHARKIADVVIVGLNSDESIRQLKGPTRPVLPFHWRRETIEALNIVDLVVELDGVSPVPLVEKYRPHVYLKGGDYSSFSLPYEEQISALVESIEFAPLILGRSSTEIAHRVSLQSEI